MDSWVRKIRWRRDRLPTPVFLGFLMAQTVNNLPTVWEVWVRSLGWEDPLEKGKANQYSGLENSMDCIGISRNSLAPPSFGETVLPD